jgi:hypothetical protein
MGQAWLWLKNPTWFLDHCSRVVTTLIAIGKIHVTLGLALGLGAALLLLDAQGWRIVSPAFDRERLITGTR